MKDTDERVKGTKEKPCVRGEVERYQKTQKKPDVIPIVEESAENSMVFILEKLSR